MCGATGWADGFVQTIVVSDEDRKLAFANIMKAAKHYGIDVSESDWKELGKHPSPYSPVHGPSCRGHTKQENARDRGRVTL